MTNANVTFVQSLYAAFQPGDIAAIMAPSRTWSGTWPAAPAIISARAAQFAQASKG